MSNTTTESGPAPMTVPSEKQRRAVKEAVGEFGIACDRAARAHREEAEALSRWGESRSDIAIALCGDRLDRATVLQHYADSLALSHAESTRVEAVDAAKQCHRDILKVCLSLGEPE